MMRGGDSPIFPYENRVFLSFPSGAKLMMYALKIEYIQQLNSYIQYDNELFLHSDCYFFNHRTLQGDGIFCAKRWAKKLLLPCRGEKLAYSTILKYLVKHASNSTFTSYLLTKFS